MSSALRYLSFLQGFFSPFPRSAREHEHSPIPQHPAPAALTSHIPDRCCSFSSFLILLKHVPDSCPMPFAPLTDLTPVEAHRGLAWPRVRQSPGCLSILALPLRLTELQDFMLVGCHCQSASSGEQFPPATRAWTGMGGRNTERGGLNPT